jgi:TetR/AcrR family transcriptional repressor of nem operon
MARTKPADERRADLLDAGQDVFVEKGVAASRLEDITSRAGVAKGTFYLYFRSKEDLLAALQERFSQRLADRITRAVEQVDDWPGKLDACVKALFDDYAAEHDLHDILFAHLGNPHDAPDTEPARSQLVDAIRDLLAAGVEAGAYDVDDLDTTAILVYSALHGGFDAASHGPERPEAARLVRAAQQLFRRTANVVPLLSQ